MTELPIHAVLPTVLSHLKTRDELVLQAPPGAGKTTVVPLSLLDQPWLADQKVLVLEPRRLAARAAAERMAGLRNESVGECVGYRVRLDSKVSSATRIEVITEGVLTRQIQHDPSLEGVGAVVFDEFHERSVDADLGLALTLYARQVFRETSPLKLIVMSATLDDAAVAELLNDAPVVTSEGRMYPVDIRYSTPWSARDAVVPRVVDTVCEALHDTQGSLLVFLPGQREIREAANQLQSRVNDPQVKIHPLFGDLTLTQQRAAIAPPAHDERKVVIATNIAQTSLTIDGVTVVVDAGLSRRAEFDPRTAMSRLKTVSVSRADADQRAGRAGRTGPGVCYRLWSDSQQRQLGAFTPPEITNADLAPLALQLLQFGVDDPQQLTWLNPPSDAHWHQAIDVLQQLQAIKQSTSGTLALTRHGEQMAALPVHPRLAHMLVSSRDAGCVKVACDLAALLSTRDLMVRADATGVDMATRLRVLKSKSAHAGVNRAAWHEARQLSQRFAALCKAMPEGGVSDQPLDQQQTTAFLLACAYPDRIAQQRTAEPGLYQLANGRAARLRDSDSLVGSTWLVAADLGGRDGHVNDVIYRAAALDESLFDSALADCVEPHENVAWDHRQNRLLAQRQQRIGKLVWKSRDLENPSLEKKQAALLGYIAKAGLKSLPFTPKINRWRARIAFLRERDALADSDNSESSSDWPDLSDQQLLATIDEWLSPYLDSVTHINHFAQLELDAILLNQLPWPLPQTLEQLAPEKIQVASGSWLSVDYSERPPVLAVRLQEMFGCADTPRVADGVALKLHLLSPAQRPVQVTQDLAGFWQGSYSAVQKDMKGRYPKHYWPDDPMAASPSRRSTRKPR